MGLEALTAMEYPGRFIIVGRSPDDESVVIYGITGRSSSSKSRKLVESEKTHTIQTQVTDPKELEKGSAALLLYPAIAFYQGGIVASNGAQTKLLYSALKRLDTESGQRKLGGIQYTLRPDEKFILSEIVMKDAMKEPVWEYDFQHDRWIDLTSFEPDEPNDTPRINLALLAGTTCFHIVRNRNGKPVSERYVFPLEQWKGHLLATYTGENKDPLPSFKGEPIPVNISWASPEDAVDSVYKMLHPYYRVAVSAVFMGRAHTDIAIKNRSEDERH